jgi:hypothetical protein
MAYFIRTMNAQQYRDALAKLNLTQVAAGELFGVGARTSRRWALDEARVPTPVAILLELMIKKRLRLEVDIPVSAERSQAERRVFTFASKHVAHALE